MTGMHSKPTNVSNLERLPKFCFSAKALLLPPIIPNRNQANRHPKNLLFKPQFLLLQPLLLPTSPFQLPLHPLHPSDRRVPPPPRFHLQVRLSDSHRGRGMVVTLTTTVIMVSTPQGAPWYQLRWRGLYCRLRGAMAFRLQAFLWAHHTKQCPQCSCPGPVVFLSIFDRL
jgi:hypothetical protein